MFDILLYSVALPMLITGSVLFVGWRLSRRPKHDQPTTTEGQPHSGWISSAAALGVGVSYVVCHLGLHGKPAGNQPEAWEWLLLLVPVSAIVGITGRRMPLSRKMLLYLVLAIAVSWFLVPSFQSSPWVWRTVLAASVFALACSQSLWRPAISLAWVWILVASFGLPILIASANAKFGFFSTSIASSAGAMFLFWLFLERTDWLDATVPVVSVLVPSILFSGYFNDYGDVPLDAFALIVGSPLSAWVARPVLGRSVNKPFALAITSLLPVAVLCLVALYRVWPILTAEPAY